MSPTVEQAVLACLVAAPSFDELPEAVQRLGFALAKVSGRNQRWMDGEDHEVMLQVIPSHAVCSVWFDGEYTDEAEMIGEFLQQKGYADSSVTNDQGVSWLVRGGGVARLFTKQGSEERLGFCLFVERH